MDATLAAAYSALALTYLREGYAFAEPALDNSATLAETWACKVVELDPNNDDAQAVLALASHLAGRPEEAWERALLALASNQNSPMINRVIGIVLITKGCSSEGRSLLLTALRLDPRAQNVKLTMHEIATSYYFERDYVGAVDAAKRVAVRYPGYNQLYRLLAAALGQLGHKDEAGKALQKWIETSPQNFVRYTRDRPPWLRAEDYEHILDGLRKAGWQG